VCVFAFPPFVCKLATSRRVARFHPSPSCAKFRDARASLSRDDGMRRSPPASASFLAVADRKRGRAEMTPAPAPQEPAPVRALEVDATPQTTVVAADASQPRGWV
jgi:hypothetical protein